MAAALAASNPTLYRHLALYLQVLRQVLPARVEQACFHLATQVHPQRYAALPDQERQALHGRILALVQRCSSLLTVEQLTALADQIDREAQHRQRRQQRELLEQLSSGAAALDPDDDEDAPGAQHRPAVDMSEDPDLSAADSPLPAGSIRLDFSLPLSGPVGRWRAMAPPAPERARQDSPKPAEFQEQRPHGEAAAGSHEAGTRRDSGADDEEVCAAGLPPGPSALDPEACDPDAADLDAADLDTTDLDATGSDAIDADAMALDSLDLDTTDSGATDLDATNLGATDLDATDLDSTDLEATAPELMDPEVMELAAYSLQQRQAQGPDAAEILKIVREAMDDSRDRGRQAVPPPDQAADSPWRDGQLPRDPTTLLRWLDGIEQALLRRLRNLSHALNVELLRVGISRGLLPVSLLDAVLEGQVDTMASPSNVLHLQLPFSLRPGMAEVHALAILLRPVDLEMDEPRLRTCRRRLLQQRQELRRMAHQFRRLQRRLQAHEAERLWLQDIRNCRPPQA